MSNLKKQMHEHEDDMQCATVTEAEMLMREVRRLLVRSESALDEEGLKKQAEQLEHWLESYRRGLSAAQKLSDNSKAFLSEMHDRLVLALEEMHRLDDEGSGTLPSQDQKQRQDDLAKAIRDINHLMCSLGEASFKTDSPETQQQ